MRRRKRDIEKLVQDVEELRRLTSQEITGEEVERLRREVAELKREFYAHLGPWQRTKLSRHPQRPYTLDYVRLLFQDFSEVHGDRNFADDPAIVTGTARYHGRPVVVVGHQKGRDTKQKLARNLGMPKLRASFCLVSRPFFTFVDTPGAYPGIDAEE